VSLFEVREAIVEYKKNMTIGKTLIFPQREDGAPVLHRNELEAQ